MANTKSQAISNMKFRKKGDKYEGRLCYNGIRKSFVGNTREECKNRAREHFKELEKAKEKQILQGIKEEKENSGEIPLSEYIVKWLEMSYRPTVQPSTFARVYNVVYCQILPHPISKMNLKDITVDDVTALIREFETGATHETPQEKAERMKEWKCRMAQNQDYIALPRDRKKELYDSEAHKFFPLLAKSGLNRLKQALSMCFDNAVKRKIIERNPCEGVEISKECNLIVETRKQDSMTLEQIKKFKETALEKTVASGKTIVRYRDDVVLVLMIATGLRIGEMCALKWSDIDIEKGLINVRNTIQTGLKGDIKTKIRSGTKTNPGRSLEINNNICTYLEMLKSFDRYHHINSEFVCTTRRGTPQTPKNLGRSLSQLLKRAGLPDSITPHTLRHTFGSILLEKGVNIADISRLMGHQKVTTTYNKYIHPIQEKEAESKTMTEII